jgi:hypothetical protein
LTVIPASKTVWYHAGKSKEEDMKRTFKVAQAAVLICALGVAGNAAAATKETQTIPETITTQKGETYQGASLVRTEPDGLVIEFRPEGGGFGMKKIKFHDLPENLREQFNYDQGAAEEFEAARLEANTNWRTRLAEMKRRPAEPQQANAQNVSVLEHPIGMEPMQYPVGRFEARGTIRGAMILDTVTGEAWLVDLHSVLQDYQQGFFVQPKVPLPSVQ